MIAMVGQAKGSENETAKYIREKVPEAEFDYLKAQKKRELESEFKSMTADQLDTLAERVAVTEIRRSVPVKDFNQFCLDRPTKGLASQIKQSAAL